jgi:hypothetical protein
MTQTMYAHVNKWIIKKMRLMIMVHENYLWNKIWILIFIFTCTY